jgi:nucleotide-binding universal stress UspA family protein
MAEANRAMEVLLASAKGKLSGVALTSEVTPGRAFEEIPARARDRRSDLIVLGANGATSLEDAIIGGTAENVMNEATCSVLIAREPARRRVA